MRFPGGDSMPGADLPRLPRRAPGVHKGQAGHVAIVAGSRGMTGAAILCGLGALRCGAGLVRVLCPESAHSIIAAAEPSLMTIPLPEDKAGRIHWKSRTAGILAEKAIGWAHAMAIGPGLGDDVESIEELLACAIKGFAAPLVLDADAFRAAKNLPRWLSQRSEPAILTPHPGEMARLRAAAGLDPAVAVEDGDRAAQAVEYAQLTRSIVVLKGHRTIIADGETTCVNATGNPGMATGGMGDVLTGAITALLAQRLLFFDAARLAVHVHGAAADRLAGGTGPIGYLAREVAAEIPAILGMYYGDASGETSGEGTG